MPWCAIATYYITNTIAWFYAANNWILSRYFWNKRNGISFWTYLKADSLIIPSHKFYEIYRKESQVINTTLDTLNINAHTYNQDL